MSDLLTALAIYGTYFLIAFTLAAIWMVGWMWVDARRDRRRKRARPGRLPDETFRQIVEAEWGDQEARLL